MSSRTETVRRRLGFQFRDSVAMHIGRGDTSMQFYLEPID